MDKPTSQGTQPEDREPLERDPESLRDLLPGNIPIVVAVALLVLMGILAVLLGLAT